MENLNLVYYSPTGTTQKIVREIAQNMELTLISENNIAINKTKSITKINDNHLTIIGSPVYGGRLPITTIETLKQFQSNQAPVVIVVVYGNRAYDDALLELKDIVSDGGFKIIAAAAFIGEHSYSSNDKPIAKNRPDKQDLKKCKDFAKLITEKIKSIKNLNKLPEIDIPGNYPYKDRKQLPANVHPITDIDRCTLSGICADSCPSNAISINETVITNGDLCTLCCACVKNCPEKARIFDNPTANKMKDNLFLNCAIRKEPEYFI